MIDDQDKENRMDITTNSSYDNVPIKSGPKFKINEYPEGNLVNISYSLMNESLYRVSLRR